MFNSVIHFIILKYDLSVTSRLNSLSLSLSLSPPPLSLSLVQAGSPSRGGDVVVYVFNKKTNKLAYSFFSSSVLVSVSVFMTLSTVFHSISSPDNSPLFHSVILVLFLPHWSFQLYIPLGKSSSALI